MASDQDKRKLSDLRVVDIRSELDKRGIDKNGVKAVILERLTKALEDEGHDVESYIFEPLGKSTLKRQAVSKNRPGSEQDSESEPPSGTNDDAHDLSMDVDEDAAADGDPADSDLADGENSDPATGNEETNGNEEPSDSKPEETPAEKVQTEEAPVESKLIEADEETTADITVEEKNPVEKKPIEKTPLDKNPAESESLKKESSEDTPEEKDSVETSSSGAMEPPTAEKVAATVRAIKTEVQEPRQTAAEKMSHDVNGVDNEDSINLDIGEDEEKLLADEDDSCGPEKENKDEGERARKSKQGKEAAAKDEDRKRSASSEEKSSKTQDDQKDDKAKSGSQEQKSKDDKDKSKRSSASGGANSRNLWVSGLSSATRATDLKQVFSKHGKVIGAKVVTNARTPGARCYGYVTMATSEEASKCIQYLHRTELHGRMISVERAKGDAGPKGEGKVPLPEKKRHEHKANGHADTAKNTAASSEASDEKKSTSAEDKTGDDKRKRRVEAPATNSTKPRSPHRPGRQPIKAPSPAQRKPRPIAALLTFAQIREERERQRLREREREVREEERRRREMIARQREVERKNRDEAARLEREKEKLRAERERIEVERAQLLRMERERQRLERERLEREREELKRHQLRLEAARRPTKPPVVKERRDYETARHAVPPAPAPPSARFDTPPVRRAVKRPAPEERRTDSYVDDRKRAVPERRFDPPPTARFEEPSRLLFPSKKDTRRPEFSPPPRREPSKFERPFVPADVRIVRPSHEASSRREQVSPGVRIKDARFERGGGDSGARAPVSGYRREERRPEPDHRAKGDMRSSGRERYPESKPSFSGSSKAGEGRYTDRGGSTWHAGTGPAPSKPFMSSLPPRVSPWERKESAGPWARPTDSSWSGGGSSAMVGSYSSSGLAAGMSSMSGGPYNSDRFDSYKASLGQVRKY